MDLLRAMQVFRTVGTTGGFASAARSLDITTAWVSKQVSQLEEHLGAQLLNRSTRSLSLTELGRTYLECCERVLAGVEEAEQLVGDLQGKARGQLNITLPMSFGLIKVAPLIGDFAQQHPEVRLNMTFNDRLVDILNGNFDLAIRVASRLQDSALSVRRLTKGVRCVCASPAYVARHGEPKTAADLSRHACLSYSFHSAPLVWSLTGPEGEERIRVQGPVQANNSLALRQALLSGAGVALVPDFVVDEDLRDGRLVRLLQKYEASSYEVYALFPPARFVPPKVQVMVEFLRQRLGGPAE